MILVDKPAGPTSFDVIARIRRRTGARTGHAGTLDPFATGLLLVLSGAATRLAPWLVGLDKRYMTDVDLTARTSTGDPEGDVVEEVEPPEAAELERRLSGLRGEVDLRMPAASAVKIGGERAYARHRRGETVEMPVRRSRVDALELVSLRGRNGAARSARRLGHVRSLDRRRARRALPDAAPHSRSGPFSVDDADEERILPPAEALPFLPAVEVGEAEAVAIRAGRVRANARTRTLRDGELVAVGKVVMPA